MRAGENYRGLNAHDDGRGERLLRPALFHFRVSVVGSWFGTRPSNRTFKRGITSNRGFGLGDIFEAKEKLSGGKGGLVIKNRHSKVGVLCLFI